jgi:hypothetical protein
MPSTIEFQFLLLFPADVTRNTATAESLDVGELHDHSDGHGNNQLQDIISKPAWPG